MNFKKLFRIILGHPKHVLRLICSILGISTAIKTALKVALYVFFDGPLASLNGKFMEKVNHYDRTKQIDFSMGPSVNLSDTTIFFEHFPYKGNIKKKYILNPIYKRIFIVEY